MTITLDPSPSFQRLEDALDHAAKHYPTRTAATYLDDGTYRRVSYDQLNLAVHELANILGRHLGSSTRDDTPFVGLFFARNLNQVVATLAVLTAGAAYVPIALDSNATNLGVILAQTKLQVVLTDSDQDGRLKHLLEQAGRLDIAVLDVSKPSGFDTLPTHNGPQPRDGQSPAYVLFSSGTTGAPKGIVTSHTAALTYCRGANELYQAASTDVWVRAAAYTFDSSIDELFCPLVAGAGIVIQPDGALTSFHSYLGFLKTSGATILALTTALWHQLTTYLVHEDRDLPSSIRVVSIGGEAALGKVFKAWRERFKDYPRLLNGYGPTEATVCATYWEAHDNINIPILPIGRPLTGYRCYILDPATHSPVGAGHEGMLYVSGPGLAIGYLNDPAQTQSKFVPNPWAESTEYARMYCTGDLARMDPGGVLHFAGRADLQVKIRGFRVELESVETCLLSFSGVKEVAVAAHKDEQAQSQSIHAYIIMASDKSDIYADDIVAHCAQTLAPYEIPARFYRVESLPYTRNRKLDRRALNETKNSAKLLPSRERAVDGEVGKLDPVLAQLWCECLDGIDLESLSASSHFLHLGGHSLTLIMLAAKIDSVLGVVVSSVDLLQNPTLDQMSKLLEPHRHKAIPNEHASLSGPKLGRGCGVSFMGKLVGKAAKRFGSLGLLRFLPFRQAEKPQSVLEKTGGPVRDLDVGTHPLSSAQARLYVAQQSAPESPVFNDGVAINITGEISDQDMCAALKALLQRHAILRVKLFQDDAAQVLQEILPFDEALFDEAFSHYKLERSEAARRAHEIFVRPFNLFEGRLIRIALLSSGAEHILVICAHHIIWDGFSDRVFLDELVSLYQGKELPPASSYFAHCYSTRAKPSPDRLSTLVSYLDSVPQVLELPVDYVRPDSQTFNRGRNVHFTVDRSSVSRLVNRLGTSPYACLMTAFAVALHLNAAGQEDFMVGIPFANRLSASEANAIGFFINMLPLRVCLADTLTLDELHAKIRKDLLFLSGLQDVPLDALVDALGISRLSSRDSLIQAMLNFTDAPEGKLDDRAKFTRYPLSNGAAHTDMVCFVELNKDGSLLGEIEYDSEIFAHESMASFASAFANILDSWSAQPTQSISGIAFPGSASHIPLVRELSPEDCSFGAFLVSSAARHWSCQAVYDDTTGGTYTYQQVFSMAHRIQQQLCPFRRVDGVVVLLLERNVDAVAVEIGVSLAGLAFAPCDISQPRLRTEEIIANCDPVCILAHRRVLDKLGVSDTDFSAPVLVVDGLQDGLPLLGSSAELRVENGGEVAYMIHTSGSTGKPKGIVIGQGSLVKVTREIISWAGGDVAISSVTTSNLAWDGICAQIWPPLGTGGCVKLPKLDGEKDGEYLSALMRRAPPTNSLLATPSAFQMWLDQTQDQPLPLFPDGVRHLMVGGEQLTPELAQRVLSRTGGSPNMHLIHPYGPTEGTVFSSYGVLKHTDLRKLVKYRRVPVDTLLPDAAMTVVDATGHELPRGFVGEIIIWGPCLMLEYLNMPDLNKQKMLVKDGVRGWRSGDLGRHLPSGGFEIFGRMDSMRKVKGGFRVDLGEIETHIHSYTQVLKCCVLLMEIPMEDGQVSQNHIVAFVKLKDEEALQMGNSQEGDEFDSIVPEMTLNGLHRHLSHRVPAYMVPDYVVRVNTFPLTNSIKIDRFKLPKPSLVHRFAARASDCVEWTDEDESRRETIEAILSIFTNVLSVDRKLTHRDNFYDCGGHSLLATRVTSLIRRNLGVPLPFTAIITHPTASELAEFVETLRLQSARSISLPPHVIPLQPAGFISKPKAMVFAFPFIGGDLDMLPRVVNQLDNVKLGLVTYGLVPEPGRKLNSLEKMAKTYAESIAQLAGSMPCILVGWCFGGMIASKASLYLPKETTYLVLFDVMHISIAGRFQMDGADFAKAFAEYLCKVWFGPGLQSAEKSGEKAAVVQAVLDAKLDWHDLPSLVALARRHVVLPPWVTDDDLAQRIRPLADSHDLVLGIYRGNCCTPAEAIAIEEQVIVNMQATDGLNNIFDTEVGLGWARYEVVDTDHDTIGYLPVATTRMLSAIRKILA
ncbi:hypothetical protein FRC08_003831 [Ceratobasidium sp. 394]|nr:hypothetical protein FRC08_003831 [Ceratobasidium sp. 394]